MVLKILIGVVVIVVVLAVIVALRPSGFRIVRAASISAPPAVVFEQVNDFHKWQAWSPWAKRDPTAKNTFEGAPAGKGSIFSWAGNKEVGEGRMTIAESRPSELIRINLEFFKPFVSTSTAEFTLKPQGDQTLVTWTMDGKNNYVARAACMFMDMDKMIGGDFEKGLADIKAISEAAARK